MQAAPTQHCRVLVLSDGDRDSARRKRRPVASAPSSPQAPDDPIAHVPIDVLAKRLGHFLRLRVDLLESVKEVTEIIVEIETSFSLRAETLRE
jgi:hypothetical protein